MIRDNEYDDYQIPEYDPSIPPDERARLLQEAKMNVKAVLEELKKDHK